MTIVDKNVVIFVLFIVVFSVVFAVSGLIAFGRQDEEHYGTPWNSWLTTFLYLTGEEQVRDILNKPSIGGSRRLKTVDLTSKVSKQY